MPRIRQNDGIIFLQCLKNVFYTWFPQKILIEHFTYHDLVCLVITGSIETEKIPVPEKSKFPPDLYIIVIEWRVKNPDQSKLITYEIYNKNMTYRNSFNSTSLRRDGLRGDDLSGGSVVAILGLELDLASLGGHHRHCGRSGVVWRLTAVHHTLRMHYTACSILTLLENTKHSAMLSRTSPCLGDPYNVTIFNSAIFSNSELLDHYLAHIYSTD